VMVAFADAVHKRTQLRAQRAVQHGSYDDHFGGRAPASLERCGAEAIVVASFAPDAVVAEVARQFDVSTSLIYKWRRDALKPGPLFVSAVMADGEGSLVPDVSRDGAAQGALA
jgi:hypothetical protein